MNFILYIDEQKHQFVLYVGDREKEEEKQFNIVIDVQGNYLLRPLRLASIS